jgi:nucleoside 2-deoxyribosyltransferase
MRVFIAAPLFSQAEREFNLKIDQVLRSAGFETVLPQRDIGDLWEHFKKHGEEAYRDVYLRDLEAIKNSDVVVAVLDGNDVDSGVAFELGYARALGKPIIGIKTDVRKFAEGEEVNNMIAQSLAGIVRDPSELPAELRRLRRERQ